MLETLRHQMSAALCPTAAYITLSSRSRNDPSAHELDGQAGFLSEI